MILIKHSCRSLGTASLKLMFLTSTCQQKESQQQNQHSSSMHVLKWIYLEANTDDISQICLQLPMLKKTAQSNKASLYGSHCKPPLTEGISIHGLICASAARKQFLKCCCWGTGDPHKQNERAVTSLPHFLQDPWIQSLGNAMSLANCEEWYL